MNITPYLHAIDFVEDFRNRLDLSKYAFAKMLKKSLPAYSSLSRASNRITLKDLINLRVIARAHLQMTDSEYLDVIESEAKRISERGARRIHRKKKPSKIKDV